jgi:hypothetical protein
MNAHEIAACVNAGTHRLVLDCASSIWTLEEGRDGLWLPGVVVDSTEAFHAAHPRAPEACEKGLTPMPAPRTPHVFYLPSIRSLLDKIPEGGVLDTGSDTTQRYVATCAVGRGLLKRAALLPHRRFARASLSA